MQKRAGGRVDGSEYRYTPNLLALLQSIHAPFMLSTNSISPIQDFQFNQGQNYWKKRGGKRQWKESMKSRDKLENSVEYKGGRRRNIVIKGSTIHDSKERITYVEGMEEEIFRGEQLGRELGKEEIQ